MECLATSLLVGFGVIHANAMLTGPVYPAPGGNGFGFTGSSAGNVGGITYSYSSFSSSAFSQLYWGLDPTYGPISSGLRGVASAMKFDKISGNTASWTGSTSYQDDQGVVSTVPTLFLATVSGLASPWIAASTVGLDAIYIGALVNNSSGQNYSVNLAFFADLDGAGPNLPMALNTVPHAEGSVSSFAGGFYYAEPVPEPTTVVAGALLLLPLGATALRKLRQSRPA